MVESANKLVVEARLKGAGMHGARANVNPMVALRAMACSDRWTSYWPLIWADLRHQRAAQRRARWHACRPVSASAPTERTPPMSVKPTPMARMERKGLIKDGRPTADHPFRKQSFGRRRAPTVTNAKI